MEKPIEQINYRRFFTVNSLICLNIQDPAVFDAVHQLPKALLEAGVFHGLRVDHIDGLYDPSRTWSGCGNWRAGSAYIVVEKILQNDEPLPAALARSGSNGVCATCRWSITCLPAPAARLALPGFINTLLGEKVAVRQELHDKKAYILYQHMNGELDNLDGLFPVVKPG